jgi:coenzyme Q-binding protein COQ10
MLKSFFSAVTKKHVEQRILKTNADHLLRIIQDVDRYKEFLPLCTESKVLRRSACGGYFDATLTVGLPPLFTETYVSRVQVKPERLTVATKSIQSKLFDSLSSEWKLQNVSTNDQDLTYVDFQVEMTVTDPIIVNIIDRVLSEVAGRQVDAFEKRCQDLDMIHGPT